MIILLKKRIFISFIMLFLPLSVFADTDIEFKCFDEVMKGNMLECDISLINSGENVKGIKINYSNDKIFSYVKTVVGSDWSVASVNNEGLAFFNINGISKDSKIGDVSFLVSNDSVIGNEYDIILSNIYLSDGEKDINISNKISKVKILSINDILKSLSVNDIALELKDGVTDYNVDVPFSDDEVVVSGVLANNKYYFIDGYKPSKLENIKVGENKVTLKIGGEGRELITFNINVNRLEESNIDNNNDASNVENPKTGFSMVWLVGILLVLSLGIILFYKIKKEER